MDTCLAMPRTARQDDGVDGSDARTCMQRQKGGQTEIVTDRLTHEVEVGPAVRHLHKVGRD